MACCNLLSSFCILSGRVSCLVFYVFLFSDTATTEIYTYGHTLSLHDALPIYRVAVAAHAGAGLRDGAARRPANAGPRRRSGLRPQRGCNQKAVGGVAPTYGVSIEGGARWPHTSQLFKGVRPHSGSSRSEEHTSEIQTQMRNSDDVFSWKKNNI